MRRRPAGSGGLFGPLFFWGAWVVSVAVWTTPAAAQQNLPDSIRDRVRARLESLRRPSAQDTLIVTDSLAQVEAGRRSARRAGGEAPDSIVQLLLGLEGYAVTEYRGTGARFNAADRRLILQGDTTARAQVFRDGTELAADSAIVYDERTGLIQSTGGATYLPPRGDSLRSRALVFDLERERGSALGARTRYSEGANWIVVGDLPLIRQGEAWGHDVDFTSCELEIPHYHFRTGEIKIIAGSVLVARPVTLYFADVPVAWLPFVAQGLGSGRSSGLLTPRFSINDIVRTSGGYRRRISNVGFYWAMSQYSDATVALDWFSDEYTALTGSVRYHWARQFLRGAVNYRQYWREDGSQELAFDTRHNWEIDERTQLRASARYASSTSLVRRNSFDPAEVTQSIDSEGGLSRRFGWGTVSLGANRRQFLSDDRVETTLPTLNLNLSPITLFPASSASASWFNNMTWTGSGSYSRASTDLAAPPDTAAFSFGAVDSRSTRGSLNSSLSLGAFSWTQSANYSERIQVEVPDTLFPGVERPAEGEPLPFDGTLRDLSEAELRWNTAIDYQQRLVGSTTLTPSLTLSSEAVRSDTIPEAGSFVTAPVRLSFGAGLRTDVYGFFPGFGSYEQIRHKLSPTFSYSYSPEVTPSELQERVFGSRGAQTRNQIRFGISQTFEAKVSEEEEDDGGPESGAVPADSTGNVESRDEEAEAEAADSASEGLPAASGEASASTARDPAADSTGPRRIDRGRTVSLLAIQTSAVTYDFVEADSAGDWTGGFADNLRIQNQISSDFLRGLTISMEHDIFEEVETTDGGGTVTGEERRFDPHLAGLNLGFSVGSRSSAIRWLAGLLGGDSGEPPPPEPPADSLEVDDRADDVFGAGTGSDAATVIPGRGSTTRSAAERRRSAEGPVGEWNTSFSYSLNRPRDESFGQASQMLRINASFRPTEKWDVSWRTAYDLEAGSFNDHVISLSRDLHRWEANFDFLQTATGNWTFRFQVSLIDNRDLQFDWEQRNLDRENSPFRQPF